MVDYCIYQHISSVNIVILLSIYKTTFICFIFDCIVEYNSTQKIKSNAAINFSRWLRLAQVSVQIFHKSQPRPAWVTKEKNAAMNSMI